jgi:hypothetical protein
MVQILILAIHMRGRRLKEDHFQVKHPRYSDVHEDDGASLNTRQPPQAESPLK